MFFSKLTILIGILFSTLGWASRQTTQIPKSSFTLSHLNLTLGNYSEYDYGVQTSEKGSISSFSYAPFMAFGLDYYLSHNLQFNPEFGYVFQRNIETAQIKKDTFWLKADISTALIANLRLRIGTSFIMNSISGSGGTQELNNGNSKEEYYIPSDRRTSINQTLDLGLEYFLDPQLSLRYQTVHFSFFNQAQEQISTILSFTYYIKQ